MGSPLSFRAISLFVAASIMAAPIGANSNEISNGPAASGLASSAANQLGNSSPRPSDQVDRTVDHPQPLQQVDPDASPDAPAGAEKKEATAAAILAESGATLSEVLTVDQQKEDSSKRSYQPRFSSSGAYIENIQIQAPDFHAIKPSLALTYSSSSGISSDLLSGWTGQGWTLFGLPEIHRQGVTGGTPTFGATDTYQIDGSDIVSCNSAPTAASCVAGGTHAEKIENYQKIQFQNNVWTITSTNGHKRIFRPISFWGTTTDPSDSNPALIRDSYRWLLSEQVDANGNTAQYTYECTTLPACYPKEISYGAFKITFLSDTYANYLTRATGRGLAKLDRRLRRVDITSGISPIRTYALNYETSPSSSLQRLVEVREYGRDRVINADGTVTGSSRPPYRFTYSNNTISLQPSQFQVPVQLGREYLFPGDFNGDGRSDLLSVVSSGYTTSQQCSVSVYLSNGTSFVKPAITPPEPSGAFGCAYTGNSGVQVADLDGDGNSDFVVFLFRNKTFTIYLTRLNADKTAISFAKYTIGSSVQSGIFDTGSVDRLADIDGDGATELILSAPLKVYDWNGSSFSATDLPFSMVLGSSIHGNGDMNADGKDDLIAGSQGYSSNRYNYSFTRYAGLNTATDGLAGTSLTAPPFYTSVWSQADIDGDGTSDTLQYNILTYSEVEYDHRAGPINTYLSSGPGLKSQSVLASQTICPRMPGEFDPDTYLPSYIALICNIATLDFTGDGRADIVVSTPTDEGGNKTPIEIFAPLGGDQWKRTTLGADSIYTFGDFNGDGLQDVLIAGEVYYSFYYPSGKVLLAGGSKPDLLKSVTRPTGGTTEIEYAPSSRWGLTAGTRMPFVTQTVSAIVDKDGRGGTSRVEYSYRGGRYDYKERKFLGFSGLQAKLPCASGETVCPSIDVTFSQAYAALGTPIRTESRDGSGTARRTVTETYEFSNSVLPYSARNIATETMITDDATVTLRKERVFDSYGNVVDLKDYGRQDLSGDETWATTTYAPNTSAYIVALPASKRVRSGSFDAASATTLSYQTFVYDAAAEETAAPVKGNLSQKRSYLRVDTDPAFYKEQYGYDAYGNRILAADDLGNKSEWDFDASYHLYPVTERSPRYFANGGQPADARFVSTTAYDTVCGKPSTKTDPNGIVETYSYDAFCRPYGYSHSGSGKYTSTRYENEGNPSQQVVVVAESLSTGSGESYKRTYYDGLGRNWRVETSGDMSIGPARVTDTGYDARGNVSQTSVVRFVGESAQWTVNSYDALDRITKSVNPDSTQKLYQYAVQTAAIAGTSNVPVALTTMTDEENHPHRNYADKDGNVIALQSLLGANWLTEVRSYDALGRLLKVRDPGGALWSYTYDLLGNRTVAVDPDLGRWIYAYDRANRLIRQGDARGALTLFTYDQMGRVLQKSVTVQSGQPVTIVASNTYDEAGTAPSHNIGLLTTAANDNAKVTTTRYYNGTGDKVRTITTIDGVAQNTTIDHSRTDKKTAIYFAPDLWVGRISDRPWQYNSADLLTNVPGLISAITYEADGQTKSITYINGVTTTFTYSPTRRWMTRLTTTKGTTVLMDNQYTRDNVGRIKTITGLTANDNWTYSYDDLGRLVSVDNGGDNTLDETYTYADNHNLLSRTRIGAYAYPASTAVRPHAATQIGAKIITYDANGNMVSDGTRTLTWDAENHLSTVTQGGSTVTFLYGPGGNRIKKIWAFGTTLYPNADVEIDRSTPGTDLYTVYPHPDAKIVANLSTATKSVFILHRDHLASVRLVTGAPNGNIVEQTGYAAFGERTNTTMQTGKGYIGERFDPETGLMYLNARFYDATFGRFVPADDEGAAHRGESSPILSPPAFKAPTSVPTSVR